MGEKGNWAGGPAQGEAPARLDAGRPASPADGKGLLTEASAKGPTPSADSKAVLDGADSKAPVGAADGTGPAAPPVPGNDGRSGAGLPPVGGVLRRRDPEDGPDSSGPQL